VSEIKLPIEVGQKFLSDNVTVVIRYVDGHCRERPIGAETPDGGVRLFAANGRFSNNDNYHGYDLQPLPVVITEGVEFSGEQYREEFERLAKEGRTFQIRIANGEWVPCRSEFYSDLLYRLVPQRTDAVGNVIKVGDRVECVVASERHGLCLGDRATVTVLDRENVTVSGYGCSFPTNYFRKLATRKRPLCADDLDKAPCPQVLRDGVRGYPMWAEGFIWFNGCRFKYDELDCYQWRPSSDQPWGPCEVTEEVLV